MFHKVKSRCWPAGPLSEDSGNKPLPISFTLLAELSFLQTRTEVLSSLLAVCQRLPLSFRSFSLSSACGCYSLKASKQVESFTKWNLFGFLLLSPLFSASCAAFLICFQPEKVLYFKYSSD